MKHASIVLLLAGCAAGIKPDAPIVTKVETLPPVQVPVPVVCVDKVPAIPNVAIDMNATPLQRYYQMKEAIAAYEGYIIAANAILLGCASQKVN